MHHKPQENKKSSAMELNIPKQQSIDETLVWITPFLSVGDISIVAIIGRYTLEAFNCPEYIVNIY